MELIKSTCGFCQQPTERRKQTKDVKVHFCGMPCKAAYQRLKKPVTKEWLAEHYIDKKMDCVQIGKLVNRDPKSVWNWLKDFGIPTRPRGDAARLPKGRPAGFTHSQETKDKIRAIAIADGRVPYDPKVGPYMRGKSGKDHPQWKGGITPERQAVYSSPEWVEAVKAVWKRADAKCERCGKHHNTTETRGTFHIHHIVSFAVRELRTEVSNLILLCKKCHRWVHSPANKQKELIKTI
jgi:hypothetical protein